MNTQPSTPHPDPDVPWLDLSDGVPEWLAEYKIQGGRPLKDLYDNALCGHSGYREAYHDVRKDALARREELREKDDEITNFRTQVNALLGRRTDLEAEVEELKRRNDNQRTEILRLRDVEVGVNGLHDDVARLVSELASAEERGKFQARMETALANRDRTLATNDALVSHNRSLQDEVDRLKEEIASLLRASAAMEVEQADAQTAEQDKAIFVPGSDGWIEGYFTEDELVKYVDTLRTDINRLRVDKVGATSASSTFLAERDAAQRRVDRLENATREKISGLTAKLEDLVDRNAKLIDERDQAWTECTELKQRVQELEEEAIRLARIVGGMHRRSSPIEPWGLVRDDDDDEHPLVPTGPTIEGETALVAPPEMKLYDGLQIGEMSEEARADKEATRVKFIDPVKLREDLWPPALSEEAIRNFQATVRGGPGTRTYPSHGSDDGVTLAIRRTTIDEQWIESAVVNTTQRPIANLPPSPIGEMNARIAHFNETTGAQIRPVTAGEVVDASIVRIMGGAIEALTRVLEEANLPTVRPPGEDIDPSYWREY